MNPRKISYADKRVLLIESSGNMRATIVQMLRQLGVVNIQAMTVNERVFELLQDSFFDIILLGHNSSDKVTGVQLLEEARYRGYMRPTSGWIFMTSDSSQAVVLHAIDSNPDYLLTKPFTVEELKNRIDQLIAKKQILHPVDVALEQGDIGRAIRACDQVSVHDPCYEFARRIKAQLLIDQGQPEKALEILETRYWEDSDKDTGLVMAQALMELERLDEARDLLQSLIETYPLFVPAMDLLAKNYERAGELELARAALQEATARSPLGIPRQMELGRVATQTRELQLAETAFRRSIVLGRNSCYRSPEPYLRLAVIRRLEMADADRHRLIELRNEFDTLLSNAGQAFPKDPELKVRTHLLRADVCRDLGESVAADRFWLEAQKLNQQLSQPLDLKRESLMFSGDAVPILEEIGELPGAKKRPALERDEALSDKVNRLAVRHYLAGKYSQALRYLNMSIEYNPTNASALLNLAQLYMEVARDQPMRREARVKMARRFLTLAQRLALTSLQRQRCEELQGYLQQPLEAMPVGSLGGLLR